MNTTNLAVMAALATSLTPVSAPGAMKAAYSGSSNNRKKRRKRQIANASRRRNRRH